MQEDGFNAPSGATQKKALNKGSLIKIAIFIACLLLVVFLLVYKSAVVNYYMKEFFAWMNEYHLRGMIAFSVLYIILALVLFPVVILALAAGYIYSDIYGLGPGMCIAWSLVFACAFTSAVITMPLGRYVFRNFLLESISKNPNYLAIEEASNEYGFTLVLLYRLAPFLPFSPFNYIVGITSISYRDYMLATLGIIPGIFTEVYVGTSISSLHDAWNGTLQGGSFTLGLIIGGLFICICGIIYVSVAAKKRINQMLDNRSLVSQVT